MRRYVKSNNQFNRQSKRRTIMSSAVDGTVTLKDTNTDVMPVVDFGTYGGMLSWALEDVFEYDAVNLEAFEGSEYYDEVAQLIEDQYSGVDEFLNQVLDYAPDYIQQAFDEYEIQAKVVPGSCQWYHPSYYNYEDDSITFDMEVDTAWVESKLAEFSNDPGFKDFLRKEFSSRSGFISYMPNDVSEYNGLLDPDDSDYWKVVSAIVQFIVSEDMSIREGVTQDLLEAVESNANYVSMRSFDY